MRVAVYARFSSDLQRAASLTDQIEVCTRYADKLGWAIIGSYSDAAASGASPFRTGYQKPLSDLDRGVFDVLLVEALDRLGRKLADVADLHDRCAFAGVRLFAVNAGEITAMHVGMLGTMAQLYLTDLREKTWCGQLGRALQGKAPGGKAFGYDVVEPSRKTGGAGERRINQAEAAVVRRIFCEFADGRSPRAIAKSLNADGIPGPGGRSWGHTTIRGQAARATGILNVRLYIGRLEWNRCAYTKDPRTGKRVARPNPPEKWEIAQVPHLRIVDDDLWMRVKARQREVRIEIGRDDGGNALNRMRRRRFLLSGQLRCGCCGGGYTIIAPDRYGGATRRSKGICSKARLSALKAEKTSVEAKLAALGAPRPLVLHPNLPALYRSKVEKLAEALSAPSTAAEAGEIIRGLIDRIVLAPVEGVLQPICSATSPRSWRWPKRRRAQTSAPVLRAENQGYCRWLRG